LNEVLMLDYQIQPGHVYIVPSEGLTLYMMIR